MLNYVVVTLPPSEQHLGGGLMKRRQLRAPRPVIPMHGDTGPGGPRDNPVVDGLFSSNCDFVERPALLVESVKGRAAS